MSEPVRLSDSQMWHELRDFYESEGVGAWSNDHIPFFATNNPALAHTYTDLFVAFIEDCEKQGLIDQEKPVYIVELGGGMGRLAFLILVRLAQLKEYLPVKVNYLLTDYSSTNVEYYQKHERLIPFIESGRLKVQAYDAEASDPLDIEVGNPVFAIANYLFDSLSHDGFRVEDGKLYEARCSRGIDEQVELSFPPAPSEPYSEASYNEVVESYRAALGNTHFPFPIGPLRCLESLSRQSGQKLCVVMADKALRSTEELLGFESLPVQKHPRGFSMSVNCHAIDQIWQKQRGFVLHSAPRSHPLNLALYGKGIPQEKALRTERVFREQIDGFGPLDYLDFRKQLLSASSRKTLALCLQLLRISRWDAELFYELSNLLGETSLAAPIAEQRVLYDAMVKCWEHFFPIGDERDVPFAVARVLACINQFEQAIHFYGESVRIYGEKALTHHNVGLCFFNLGRLEEARDAFLKALEVEPEYGPSKELLVRLEAEACRRSRLSP